MPVLLMMIPLNNDGWSWLTRMKVFHCAVFFSFISVLLSVSAYMYFKH